MVQRRAFWVAFTGRVSLRGYVALSDRAIAIINFILLCPHLDNGCCIPSRLLPLERCCCSQFVLKWIARFNVCLHMYTCVCMYAVDMHLRIASLTIARFAFICHGV
jgi:hypothetical protein